MNEDADAFICIDEEDSCFVEESFAPGEIKDTIHAVEASNDMEEVVVEGPTNVVAVGSDYCRR